MAHSNETNERINKVVGLARALVEFGDRNNPSAVAEAMRLLNIRRGITVGAGVFTMIHNDALAAMDGK